MAIQGKIEGEWIISFNIVDSAKDRYPDDAAILKGMQDGSLHAEHTFYKNEPLYIYVWDDSLTNIEDQEVIAEIHTQYIGGCFGSVNEWAVVPDDSF